MSDIKGLLTEMSVESFNLGVKSERERIIRVLTDLKVIRRDALGYLVAFNTDGTEVIYLTGLEGKTDE